MENSLNIPEIHKGDVLISHRKNYHYVVDEISGTKATIRWLHRKTGENYQLITYRRDVKLDRAPTDYDVLPRGLVDWSIYTNS
jgi:hypothetical protein